MSSTLHSAVVAWTALNLRQLPAASCSSHSDINLLMEEVVPLINHYPLVNVYITMENRHFEWETSLEMAIFNSYVELPEGNFGKSIVRKIGYDIESIIFWIWTMLEVRLR